MAATAPSAAPPQPAPARMGKSPRRRGIKWIIAAAVVLLVALGALRYWHQQRLFVTTDNAYVQANQVEIAAQVTGPVMKVSVRDQQHVNAGDALFDIDPGNYDLAVAKARAQLDLARQAASQEGAAIASAEAVL